MSDSNDEGLPNLEIKLDKMIDKLIETDEDLEKNGLNSFFFNDELCESKYKKLFEKEKENSNNSCINNSQLMNNTQINNSIIMPQNKLMNEFNFVQNNPTNISAIIINNNNYLQNLNYPMFQPINNKLNNSSLYSMNNSCMNTTDFYSNYNRSLDNNTNFNFDQSLNYTNNYIYYNPNNKSVYGENENNFKVKNPKFLNKTFINANKISFNNKNDKLNNNLSINLGNSNNNNLFNSNVELEMLLFQMQKSLCKIKKIDISIYNKCKGKFEEIILTHKGSRIFQRYLKNTHYSILHLIFSEIKKNLNQLLKDIYSNYFCKKLFRNLSQNDRKEYLTIIQNDLLKLSKDPTATYPIQSIIEELGSKNEKNLLYQGIKNNIGNLSYHIYGSRILEKILYYFDEEFHHEIIDYICDNFIELACDMNGICLVKKILLMTHKKELHQKLKKLIYDNALNLIVHQYGNYAIQTIIENWNEPDLKDILEIYKNKYVSLSVKKYSSNVIERILEKNERCLEDFINEIIKEYNLGEILKNKYGNFVLKKAYDLSSGELKKKLFDEILLNLKSLNDVKIINKWKGKFIHNNSKFI